MKYILFEDFSGQPVPFIFPDRVDHEDMREQLPYSKVLSAGFISLEDGKLRCYGGSGTLGVNSRPEDGSYITTDFLLRDS